MLISSRGSKVFIKKVNWRDSVLFRKAVRAAIVLQPLLGITNSLQMVATPDSTNIVYFATWSVVTTFLVSFQGFFASLFYCFLNGEVSIFTDNTKKICVRWN